LVTRFNSFYPDPVSDLGFGNVLSYFNHVAHGEQSSISNWIILSFHLDGFAEWQLNSTRTINPKNINTTRQIVHSPILRMKDPSALMAVISIIQCII
jgi:hypothetical protein